MPSALLSCMKKKERKNKNKKEEETKEKKKKQTEEKEEEKEEENASSVARVARDPFNVPKTSSSNVVAAFYVARRFMSPVVSKSVGRDL